MNHDTNGIVATTKCLDCQIQFSSVEAFQLHRLDQHSRVKLEPIDDHCQNCPDLDSATRIKRRKFKNKNSSLGGIVKSEIDSYNANQTSFSSKAVEKPQTKNRNREESPFECKPIACQSCSYIAKTERLMQHHIQTQHNPHRKIFSCHLCDYSCLQERTYHLHQLRHSQQDAKFACDQCGKLFLSMGIMKRHALTHNKLQPFICDFKGCGRGFNIKSRLTDHQRYVHKKCKTLNSRSRGGTDSCSNNIVDSSPSDPSIAHSRLNSNQRKCDISQNLSEQCSEVQNIEETVTSTSSNSKLENKVMDCCKTNTIVDSSQPDRTTVRKQSNTNLRVQGEIYKNIPVPEQYSEVQKVEVYVTSSSTYSKLKNKEMNSWEIVDSLHSDCTTIGNRFNSNQLAQGEISEHLPEQSSSEGQIIEESESSLFVNSKLKNKKNDCCELNVAESSHSNPTANHNQVTLKKIEGGNSENPPGQYQEVQKMEESIVTSTSIFKLKNTAQTSSLSLEGNQELSPTEKNVKAEPDVINVYDIILWNNETEKRNVDESYHDLQEKNLNLEHVKNKTSVCGTSSVSTSTSTTHSVACGYNSRNVGRQNSRSKFTCSWVGCGKTFRDGYNLRIHTYTHTGEMQRACKLCGYSCVQKSALDKHMKGHLKDHVKLKK